MFNETVLYLAVALLLITCLWQVDGLHSRPAQLFTANPGRLAYSWDYLLELSCSLLEPAGTSVHADNIPPEVLCGHK